MNARTKGPWKVIEMGGPIGTQPGPAYIHIAGPNGEKICDIFPHAGIGGVGLKAARANAALIALAGSKGEAA